MGRQLNLAGAAATLAGANLSTGTIDGVGGQARFISASTLTRDSAGNLYVADGFGGTVRKVAPDGTVTTSSIRLVLPISASVVLPLTPTVARC